MRELLSRIWKKDEGFSLIELIIVIAILAIIAAIAVPNLLGNIQKANVSTDSSNGKLIADSIATAIANNPTWEGTAIAADTPFVTVATSPTVPQQIINAAITNLNGNVPTLKSNKFGTVGTSFEVEMTTGGVITIESDTDVEIFPTPNPAP